MGRSMHELRLMDGRHKKIFDPFGIPHFVVLLLPSDNIDFVKQLLRDGKTPRNQVIN